MQSLITSKSEVIGSSVELVQINGLLGIAREIDFPRVAKWQTSRALVQPTKQVFIGVLVEGWMIGRKSEWHFLRC